MTILKIFVATWVMLVVTGLTVAIFQNTSLGAPSQSPGQRAVTTDVWTSEMLDSDFRMLEQMRAGVSPRMGSMITADPMWRDPAMIRAQERYQAQIDRMMARR